MIDKFFLESKIKENLYELFAKDFDSARDSEIFISLARTLRLLVGKKWNENLKNNRTKKVLYLLSFEYSLDNLLLSNSIKLGVLDDITLILKKYGKDFEKIQKYDKEFSLGFGDLGTLTGASIDYSASYGRNVYAYGLRYRNGMLKQEIIDGRQVEKIDNWKINKNPWEHSKEFYHQIELKNSIIKAIPFDIPVIGASSDCVNTIRLWKSSSKEDIDFEKFSEGHIHESYKKINEANSIVEFLYPQEDTYNGRVLRLSQEYFFASACIQDILKKYKKYKSTNIREIHKYINIQICDVHPVLSTVVFVDILMKKYGINLEEALKISKEIFIFTHTSLLPENFESWEISLINDVCPQIKETIHLIDGMLKKEFKVSDEHKKNSLLIINNGKVNLMNLAYYISGKIFYLSDTQLNLLKEKYMEEHYHFYNSKYKKMIVGMDAINYIKSVNANMVNPIFNNDYKSFSVEKYNSKLKLIEKIDTKGVIINPKSIFISKVGTFHEYKRQLLSILSIALLYYKLKQNANIDIVERTYFIGGKSYPNYFIAKEYIRFVNSLADLINNDISIKGKIKIIFIKDYSSNEAKYLIPATDIFEEVSNFTMTYNDISLLRYSITGGSILAGKNSLTDNYREIIGNNYIFEKKEKDNFNIDSYLYENGVINELFGFLKSQDKNSFPYNIDTIYNSLYYFNDAYDVLYDLFSHFEMMDKMCKDYMNKDNWNKNVMDTIHRAIKSTKNIYFGELDEF